MTSAAGAAWVHAYKYNLITICEPIYISVNHIDLAKECFSLFYRENLSQCFSFIAWLLCAVPVLSVSHALVWVGVWVSSGEWGIINGLLTIDCWDFEICQMLLIATKELGSGSERNLQNTVTEVFGKVIYGRRPFICPFGRLLVTTISSPPPDLIWSLVVIPMRE